MECGVECGRFSGMRQVDLAPDRRSWGYPGGSSRRDDACGPCRRHGNRPERDSHPGLDGAKNAPPTTAHKAYFSSVDDQNKERKMTRLQSEGGSRDELPSSLRSDK